jgi:hypothetical protein
MGIIASLMALWVFGPSNFIIPTLLIILGSVAAGRKLLDRKAGELL